MTWLSFRRHHPYAPAPEDTRIVNLRSVASPGELLSVAVSVMAETSAVEIEITAAALGGSAGTIPVAAIEVFVAKVWEQAGVGVYQSERTAVAELLVKDDREVLRDGYISHCEHWWHRLRSRNYYSPPHLRMSGPVRTALAPASAKLVWVSVRLPADCAVGLYTGHLEVQAADPALPALRLQLEIEVLPLTLVAPQQDLLLFYKGTLNCRLPRHHVSEATFTAQLQDIHDHGFTSLSLTEDRPRLLQRALDVAHAIGFRRNILLVSPFPRDLSRIDFHGMTPIYYISDEPDVHGAAFMAALVRDWHVAKRSGALSMASLLNHAFASRFDADDDIGHAPDILLLYLATNLHFFSGYAHFAELRARAMYYYWLTHMEKPLLHRVLAGLYLWKSKARGIAPYCYQHLPVHPYSPLDDFDEWEPGYHVGGERRPFKDHMTTYRAQQGSIPTLQWKALSDGLTDLKYLATAEAALGAAEQLEGKAAGSLAADVRHRIETFVDRISLMRVNIVSDTDPAPYIDVDAQDLARFRCQLAADIVELQALRR